MSLLCLLLFCQAVGKGPPSISCHHAILCIYPVFLILATYHSHAIRLEDYQIPLQYDLSYWYSNTRKLGSHLNSSKPPHFLPSNQPLTCIPMHPKNRSITAPPRRLNRWPQAATGAPVATQSRVLVQTKLGTMRSGNFCLGSFWEMLDGYEFRCL